MIEDSIYTSPKAAGERIRLVRQALDFSRRELSEKYPELSAGVLRKWEEGRFNGLTPKGAEKLQKIFKEEGVEVTIEWLLQGFGQAPSILNKRLLADKLAGLSSQALNHELRVFHQLHKDAISAIVEDDGMAPCLQRGYHVAGTKLSGDNIQKAIGFPSIVHLSKGQTLIRMVEEGVNSKCYNLVCTNSSTSVKHPVIEDVELYSAAPIIWIRKPEITTS